MTNTSKVRVPLLLLSSCALSSAAWAQGETAFVRGKGEVDIAIQATWDYYDEFWVGSDKMSADAVGDVERLGFSTYIAYGATDDLDLIANAGWVQSSSDGTGGFPTESDFQDMVLAAKWRVVNRPVGGGEFAFALLPGVKFPLTDYENNDVTAIGDGQTDYRARVVAQMKLNNGAYAALETGYDVRDGDPDDEVPIHFTVGATIAQTLTLSPFISRVESLGGTDIGDPDGFPSNEEDYTRTGISLYWRLAEQFGLTGGWRTTLDGRNTGDVDGFSVGMVFSP